jgi:hypothetical protein
MQLFLFSLRVANFHHFAKKIKIQKNVFGHKFRVKKISINLSQLPTI